MSKFSIIIPTFNEAYNLPLLLSDLSIIQKEGEIIVIDGGSQDKTKDIAKIYGAKIKNLSEKSRGLQLNIGAKSATGEWFIFLHADSRLTKDWLTTIKPFLNGIKSYIYFFKFKVLNKNLIYRFLEILVNFRSCLLRIPYGDQGLIIHRKTYFENNGYSKIPIMEDVDFIKRLKNKRLLKQINNPIYISSRKWEKTNIFFQALRNWNYRRRWLKGDSIDSIYRDYYKK